jgi:hypothetical protein
MYTSTPSFLSVRFIKPTTPNVVIGITGLNFLELRRDESPSSQCVSSFDWKVESILGLEQGDCLCPEGSHWEVWRLDGNIVFKMEGDCSISWGVPLHVELPFDTLADAVRRKR